MSYCVYCGAEKTVKVFTGYYDKKTGKKTYRVKCPNIDAEPCKHDEHEYTIPLRAWWGIHGYMCSRCGHVTGTGDLL
jgi:hypothetical protein